MQLRIGTIVEAEPHEGARKAAYRLVIDFGDLGEKQSSAQITDKYQPDELVGRQVIAVTGFEPRRVGGFRSDVLVLGALTPSGVVLINTDLRVANGSEVA